MLPLNTDPGVERPGRIVQKLLLPGINLIGVNLIAHGASATVACSRNASSAIFAFSAASVDVSICAAAVWWFTHRVV